jgi:hypothetical protein
MNIKNKTSKEVTNSPMLILNGINDSKTMPATSINKNNRAGLDLNFMLNTILFG